MRYISLGKHEDFNVVSEENHCWCRSICRSVFIFHVFLYYNFGFCVATYHWGIKDCLCQQCIQYVLSCSKFGPYCDRIRYFSVFLHRLSLPVLDIIPSEIIFFNTMWYEHVTSAYWETSTFYMCTKCMSWKHICDSFIHLSGFCIYSSGTFQNIYGVILLR